MQIDDPPEFEGRIIGDTSLEDIPKILKKNPMSVLVWNSVNIFEKSYWQKNKMSL